MDGNAEIVWTARRRFWHRLQLAAESARMGGDRTRAIAAFEAARAHAEEIGDADWRPLARTLHGLGRCLEEAGELEPAEEVFEQLIAHERAVLDGSDPKRAPALVRLAWVRIALDRRRDADALLPELRELARGVRERPPAGGDDPAELLDALSLRMVGELLGAMDRLDEAVELLTEALSRLERCAPRGSGLILETRVRLAGVSARRDAGL